MFVSKDAYYKNPPHPFILWIYDSAWSNYNEFPLQYPGKLTNVRMEENSGLYGELALPLIVLPIFPLCTARFSCFLGTHCQRALRLIPQDSQGQNHLVFLFPHLIIHSVIHFTMSSMNEHIQNSPRASSYSLLNPCLDALIVEYPKDLIMLL